MLKRSEGRNGTVRVYCALFLCCVLFFHYMSQGTLTELLNYFGELSINYYTNFNKGEDTANNNFANIISARLVNTSEVRTTVDNEGHKFLTHS
mmetsp:Transcript_15757/g.21663  ORF Transcript_15757/g.21663 Transcript_15757/m.21663 type:complete len:93 (+) Transcript_15757:192-470(+)